MNTGMTWQTESLNSAETEQLAERIGKRLRGGEVLELASDLGGGKTTFTRGLARGAGSTDKVSSPSFTLSREYTTPAFTIAHFDFYRLSEAGIVADELAEFVHDPAYVCVVEWGDAAHDVLPADRVTVHIARTAKDTRMITIEYPAELRYLLKDIA